MHNNDINLDSFKYWCILPMMYNPFKYFYQQCFSFISCQFSSIKFLMEYGYLIMKILNDKLLISENFKQCDSGMFIPTNSFN